MVHNGRANFNSGEKKININEIFERLGYIKETGQIFWKKPLRKKSLINKIINRISNNGYVIVKIYNTRIQIHRIVWLFENGTWPNGVIDHVDGNKLNNKYNNLRVVTMRTNSQNRKEHRNGNLLGAHKNTKSNKNQWASRIQINGKSIYLGSFRTQVEAHNAYIEELNKHLSLIP